jgi:hypothetical protein
MKTILILTANPTDTQSLRLDEEVREIDGVLRRAGRRDQFELKSQLAVRPRDLQQALLRFKPSIAHFSGHGTGEKGLVFVDDIGKVKLIDAESLAGLFRLFVNQVECVILNACYSEEQAKAIAQHINYVIGMNQPIKDQAAIEFAVGFYNALGEGVSYEEAYHFGCNAIQLAGISDEQIPVLMTKKNWGCLSTNSLSVAEPLKSKQFHHDEIKLAELQEHYNFLSEEIRELTKSLRIDFLAPIERIKQKRQIHEREIERERLARDIEDLESRIY